MSSKWHLVFWAPRAEKATAVARSKLVKELEDCCLWFVWQSLTFCDGSWLQHCYNTQVLQSCPHDFLKDAHNRSWNTIKHFMDENMETFTGKSTDAEATVMPPVRQWLNKNARDYGASNEYTVQMFLNAPTIGVMTAGQRSFFVNFVCNVLADFPRNGICFLVHPNRAQHEPRKDAENFVHSLFVDCWTFPCVFKPS